MTILRGFFAAKSFMIIDFKFYNYRYVENSIVHSKRTSKHTSSYIKLLEEFEEFIKKNNLWDDAVIMHEYIYRLFSFYIGFDGKYYNDIKSKISNISQHVIKKQNFKIRFSCKFPKIAKLLYPLWRLKIYPKIFMYNLI